MLSRALSTSNLSRSCPRLNNNDPVPSSTKSNHHCGRLHHLLSQRSCSVRILSTLIGQKVHASQTAIVADQLLYRALQHLHLQAMSHHGHAGKVIVPLTSQVQGDLEWWVSESCCRLNGLPIQLLPINLIIWTDARLGHSLPGGLITTGVHWSVEKAKSHLKFLALKALLLP